MAIVLPCLGIGLDAGYARISQIRGNYPVEDGLETVDATIHVYVSQAARDAGLEPVQVAFVTVPLSVFNGAYTDGGEHPAADVRETFYSFLMTPGRELTAGEMAAGLDFRAGLDA
jgi:hypothetical protein